ncbi:MAG TPA: hypothetical protein PLX97_12405 [Gemmatales bacterium]|nr:hypothetical protein [Gemmatales bacterium]
MNDPLDHMWKVLRADSSELANNTQLEKRLMQEMNKMQKPNSLWRKVAIAAGVLAGCLALGSGIAVAAGYNPLQLFYVVAGTSVVLDENGNPTDAVKVVSDTVDPATGQRTVQVQSSVPGTSTIVVTPK